MSLLKRGKKRKLIEQKMFKKEMVACEEVKHIMEVDKKMAWIGK
jgi:hypothetical protein